MSEFKYACPVCGQHIKCDVSQAGSVMECPTCFQKITVPQAPASGEQKFILTGTQVSDRPDRNLPSGDSTRFYARTKFPPVALGLLILALAGAAGLFAFRGKIFPAIHPAGAHFVKKHGAIGLGTWNTQAEYTNAVVTQGTNVLFKSDFRSGFAGWQLRRGSWITTNGVLVQYSGANDCRAIAGAAGWSDYTFSVRARKYGGKEGFLILFNVADDANWSWWNIGGWGNTRSAIEDSTAGVKSTLGKSVPIKITTGQWYDLRVELSGPHIRCYLDNNLVQEADYPSASAATSP